MQVRLALGLAALLALGAVDSVSADAVVVTRAMTANTILDPATPTPSARWWKRPRSPDPSRTGPGSRSRPMGSRSVVASSSRRAAR